jgi:hypothetical protein
MSHESNPYKGFCAGNASIIMRQSSMGSKLYRLAQKSALFWPFIKVVNIEG